MVMVISLCIISKITAQQARPANRLLQSAGMVLTLLLRALVGKDGVPDLGDLVFPQLTKAQASVRIIS